jgi:hypothetical protein
MLASLFALLPLLSLTSAGPITKRATNVLIESGRNPGQCLSVQGGRSAVSSVTNDTPVVTVNCGSASYWDISRGSGSVIVSGTNYAFDIGLNPGNNGGVKVFHVPRGLVSSGADLSGLPVVPRGPSADLVPD